MLNTLHALLLYARIGVYVPASCWNCCWRFIDSSSHILLIVWHRCCSLLFRFQVVTSDACTSQLLKFHWLRMDIWSSDSCGYSSRFVWFHRYHSLCPSKLSRVEIWLLEVFHSCPTCSCGSTCLWGHVSRSNRLLKIAVAYGHLSGKASRSCSYRFVWCICLWLITVSCCCS